VAFRPLLPAVHFRADDHKDSKDKSKSKSKKRKKSKKKKHSR
jgi:hypothetical protein